MLLIDQPWTSDGASSGGLDAIQVPDGVTESMLFGESSTLVTLSTTSFEFQTALASTGPWFVEASTALAGTATVKGAAVLRLTGPYKWMRPVLKTASTGTIRFRLIGV